jgi:hypothetical protein
MDTDVPTLRRQLIPTFDCSLLHFFSIKMEWTATAKEVEKQGFRVGLEKVFKEFKSVYLFCIPAIRV